jgi:transposase
MSRKLFWLTERQWGRIEPHWPKDSRGKERGDDRGVIGGIVHGPKSGWCDCPPASGPPRRQMIDSPRRIARRQGEKGAKQAIGRSRGGRNTKIHADAKGRLLAILLSDAHDCPVAGHRVRKVKPSKHMRGDKAYASAELREEPSRSNRSCRKRPFTKRLCKARWLIGNAVSRKTSGASQPVTTDWRSGLCPPRRRSCLVDLMSLDPNT